MATGKIKKISDKVIAEFAKRANWDMQIDSAARIGVRQKAYDIIIRAGKISMDEASSAKRVTCTLVDVVNGVCRAYREEFGDDADAGDMISKAFGVEGIPNKPSYEREDLPEEPNMHVPGTTKSGEKRNLIDSLNSLRPNEVKNAFKTTKNAPMVATVFAQRAADEMSVQLLCRASQNALADKKKRIAEKHLMKNPEEFGHGSESTETSTKKNKKTQAPKPEFYEIGDNSDFDSEDPYKDETCSDSDDHEDDEEMDEENDGLPNPPDGMSVLPGDISSKYSVGGVKGSKKAVKATQKKPLTKSIPIKIKLKATQKSASETNFNEDPFADDDIM